MIKVKLAIAVFLGAGIGGWFRYLATIFIQSRLANPFPYGTLSVNLVGSFVLGLVQVLLIEHGGLSLPLRVGITVGVLGGFTTFSTLSLEIMLFLHEGKLGTALGYAVISVGMGVLAVGVGILLGQRLTAL